MLVGANCEYQGGAKSGCQKHLNTDLAKKPRECLEYIVVHEMVHLIERHHNDRFRKYMDQLLPQWHRYQGELNSAPLAHEKWGY